MELFHIVLNSTFLLMNCQPLFMLIFFFAYQFFVLTDDELFPL